MVVSLLSPLALGQRARNQRSHQQVLVVDSTTWCFLIHLTVHFDCTRNRPRYSKDIGIKLHSPNPNALTRNLVVTQPEKVSVTDITYIVIAEDYLYLADVMDLYSRQLMGVDLCP